MSVPVNVVVKITTNVTNLPPIIKVNNTIHKVVS